MILDLHNRKLEYKPNMMHHRFPGLVFDPVKTKLLHSLSVEYSEEYCDETDDEYPGMSKISSTHCPYIDKLLFHRSAVPPEWNPDNKPGVLWIYLFG